MAFYRLEPFGEERADFRQALTTSMLYNINRRKHVDAADPEDFMPFTERQEKSKGLTGKEGALLASRIFRHVPRKKKQ